MIRITEVTQKKREAVLFAQNVILVNLQNSIRKERAGLVLTN